MVFSPTDPSWRSPFCWLQAARISDGSNGHRQVSYKNTCLDWIVERSNLKQSNVHIYIYIICIFVFVYVYIYIYIWIWCWAWLPSFSTRINSSALSEKYELVSAEVGVVSVEWPLWSQAESALRNTHHHDHTGWISSSSYGQNIVIS